MINPLDEYRLLMTRRHFFSRCSLGLGTAALAALLKEDGLAVGHPKAERHNQAACQTCRISRRKRSV